MSASEPIATNVTAWPSSWTRIDTETATIHARKPSTVPLTSPMAAVTKRNDGSSVTLIGPTRTCGAVFAAPVPGIAGLHSIGGADGWLSAAVTTCSCAAAGSPLVPLAHATDLRINRRAREENRTPDLRIATQDQAAGDLG